MLYRGLQPTFGVKVTWSVKTPPTEVEIVDQKSVLPNKTRSKSISNQTQDDCYKMLGPLLESIIQLFCVFMPKIETFPVWPTSQTTMVRNRQRGKFIIGSSMQSEAARKSKFPKTHCLLRWVHFPVTWCSAVQYTIKTAESEVLNNQKLSMSPRKFFQR